MSELLTEGSKNNKQFSVFLYGAIFWQLRELLNRRAI